MGIGWTNSHYLKPCAISSSMIIFSDIKCKEIITLSCKNSVYTCLIVFLILQVTNKSYQWWKVFFYFLAWCCRENYLQIYWTKFYVENTLDDYYICAPHQNPVPHHPPPRLSLRLSPGKSPGRHQLDPSSTQTCCSYIPTANFTSSAAFTLMTPYNCGM